MLLLDFFWDGSFLVVVLIWFGCIIQESDGVGGFVGVSAISLLSGHDEWFVPLDVDFFIVEEVIALLLTENPHISIVFF